MRILIVSNRLPVVVERQGQDWGIQPGSGGLVTALSPILQRWGGVWIGWPGAVETHAAEVTSLLGTFGREAGYDLQPVWLTPDGRRR